MPSLPSPPKEFPSWLLPPNELMVDLPDYLSVTMAKMEASILDILMFSSEIVASSTEFLHFLLFHSFWPGRPLCQVIELFVRIPVSSPYIEVRMDTSGPYTLVKARTDTSGICTPTRHTGHTHNLHFTYTIDQHSLRACFTRAIYTTCTKFTSTLYACTIYSPKYAYNQCQKITCTAYAPNLRIQPTS